MTVNATPETQTTWTIDPAHTLVEFSTKHMMITTVKGRFADVQGTIVTDERDPAKSSAEVTIAAASLSTGTDGRDEHLRSADFFDVEKFPSLTFRSKRIEGGSLTPGAAFTVVGDLTIRDVTKEVTLSATFEGAGTDPWGNEKASFAASTKVDRREFGLTWNAALETGGVLVSNDIRIAIEAQAVKAAA
ncbi:MAG: YceI family protein [Gemmatimonadaceae bacterium]|nr:YceI family protein [Gemmatimonadaceae bacterium]